METVPILDKRMYVRMYLHSIIGLTFCSGGRGIKYENRSYRLGEQRTATRYRKDTMSQFVHVPLVFWQCDP